MIFLFTLWFPSTEAMTPNDVSTWLHQHTLTPHSQTLHEYGELSEAFHQALQTWTRQQLARSTRSALQVHTQEICTEGALFKSIDPKSIAHPHTDIEDSFVRSLFVIESSYCLPNVQLQHAFDTFMSPAFRIDVMPQVSSYTVQGPNSCVQTSGVTGILLPSKYCTLNHVLTENKHIVVRSSLASSQMDSAHQPLYYREEVILFSQQNQGVAVYRATFSRSQDLGMTSTYLLRNTVASSQQKIRDGYYDWLTR